MDTVQLVIDELKVTFGSEFATYYYGDPEAIPLFNLPAIIVTQNNDDTTEGAFGQDDVTDNLTIKIVLNKKDDFNSDKVDPLNMTERKLKRYVGLKDKVTKKYDGHSIKHTVRSRILAPDNRHGLTAVAPTLNVEYGINPRAIGLASNTEYADLTAEAHVSFGVQYTVDT